MEEDLLTVEDLRVTFRTRREAVQPVRGISFSLKPAETVALVGESGCGKSLTALTLMGLVQRKGCQLEGRAVLEQTNLLNLSEKEFQKIRGRKMGMVFQDPMTSLNPTMRIGAQIAEAVSRHQRLTRTSAWKQAIEMLDRVGIPEPQRRVNQYPYQYSGGMRQRAMIAMALACRPKLLIADEPTTALDVTIQAQILELLQNLQKEFNTSILLITHDLGIVAGTCDRVMVMYAGEIVERGSIDQIFYHPSHPYTRGLLASCPQLAKERGSRLPSIPGTPPNPHQFPPGCAFAPRCPHAMQVCTLHAPPCEDVGEHHQSRCWLHDSRASHQRQKFEEDSCQN